MNDVVMTEQIDQALAEVRQHRERVEVLHGRKDSALALLEAYLAHAHAAACCGSGRQGWHKEVAAQDAIEAALAAFVQDENKW